MMGTWRKLIPLCGVDVVVIYIEEHVIFTIEDLLGVTGIPAKELFKILELNHDKIKHYLGYMSGRLKGEPEWKTENLKGLPSKLTNPSPRGTPIITAEGVLLILKEFQMPPARERELKDFLIGQGGLQKRLHASGLSSPHDVSQMEAEMLEGFKTIGISLEQLKNSSSLSPMELAHSLDLDFERVAQALAAGASFPETLLAGRGGKR